MQEKTSLRLYLINAVTEEKGVRELIIMKGVTAPGTLINLSASHPTVSVQHFFKEEN